MCSLSVSMVLLRLFWFLDFSEDAGAGPLPSEDLVKSMLETIRSPDFCQSTAEDGTIVLRNVFYFDFILKFESVLVSSS